MDILMSDSTYIQNSSEKEQPHEEPGSTRPESVTVELHGKCTSCQRLLRTLVVPNVAAPVLVDYTKPEKWQPVLMCTVLDLLQSRKNCHICSMISAAMEKNPRNRFVERFRDANVYVQARARAGTLTVSVRLARSLMDDIESCGLFGPFNLRSYEFADVDGPFNQHVTAKQISRHSRDNIVRAKSWVDTCLAGHERCRAFQVDTVNNQQRPSRVLEVTETSARLRCNMSNEAFDYVALSHMWGTQHSEQIQLLKSNLADFQVNIPWTELCASTIYEEAIRITWRLGYRYLWIDSLCIIQESKSDWQHEAARMAIVFGNATCNISFLFSSQHDTTATLRADPRNWNPCILREATPTHPGLYIERSKPAADLPPWLIQPKWPLFGRAWVFQEYLLPPRTLLVGHTNLMFQCSEIFYDELLGPIGDGNGMLVNEEKSTKATGTDFSKTKYFPAALTRVALAASLSDVAVLLFIEDWLKVFNEYRARDLSYASDRIVAFAGVARAFSQLGKLTYLAGAWKECLPLCLLWYLDKKPTDVAMEDNNLPDAINITYEAIIREKISDPDSAPSWSWFSIPIYAYHNLHLLLCSDELSLRRKSNLYPQTTSFTNIFFATQTNFQFPTHPANTLPPHPSSFANFTHVEITLSTRILPPPGPAKLPALLSSQLGYIQLFPAHPDDADFDCDPVFQYYHDDLVNPRRNPPKNALLALMAEIQIVRVAGKYGVQRILVGLVLMPGSERGTWKRVGVWKLKMKIWGVGVEEGCVGVVAERWKEYEICGEGWEMADITLV